MNTIVFIVKSFTFNNKHTSVSDDFLNSIKTNKYNTIIFYDNQNREYVKTCINKINPSVIILFEVNPTDSIIKNNFNYIYLLNIPIYIFVEDTYYVNSVKSLTNITGLILWYKSNLVKDSFKVLNDKLNIVNFNSRYVNTNIYKDYKQEKKYDILLYGSRTATHPYKTQPMINIQNYIKKYEHHYNITIPSANAIQFYPLRIKLESILNKLQHKYNICILPETSILDPNIQNIANANLSMLINQSYLTVACSSIADVMFHKHLEIPASKSVILGSYPTEYADLYKDNTIDVNEFMDEATIINIIDNALSNKQKLLEMSEQFYTKIHEEHNLYKAVENCNEIIDYILQK